MQIAVALGDHGSTIAIRTTNQSASRIKNRSPRRTVEENAGIQQPSILNTGACQVCTLAENHAFRDVDRNSFCVRSAP